jgi:hypothetical protein
MRAARPIRLIVLDLVTRTKLGKKVKVFRYKPDVALGVPGG